MTQQYGEDNEQFTTSQCVCSHGRDSPRLAAVWPLRASAGLRGV